MPAYDPATTYQGKPRKHRATSPEQVLANAKAATKGMRKPGRPSVYHSSLCDRVVALGKRGFNWASIAAEFNISRETLNQWQRDVPEFSDAMSRARAASQAWWERKAQSKLGAKHFQANAARMVMAAQFEDYREAKQASAGEVAVDLLQAIEAVAKALQPGSPVVIEGTAKVDAMPAAQDVVALPLKSD